MNRNDRGLALLGRVLIALIFVIAGVHKALAFTMTVGYFGKLGIPMPELLVPLSILVEVGGGILLVLGYRLVIVATVMALFTLAAALSAHQFWAATDPATYNAQFNNFMKNIAMIGGFVMVIVDARRARK